jgi:SOS response regulatory protein OraA/RecX
MVTLVASSVEKDWYEVRQGGSLVKELYLPFPLRSIPAQFDSLEELELWLVKEEKKQALACAHRWLAIRARSRSELLKKLLEKRFSRTLSEQIVAHCVEAGYIQDEELAVRWIQREVERGRGPHWIEGRLQQKGLDPRQVRREVSDQEQRDRIRQLLEKKTFKSGQQAARFLARRGFDTRVIFSVLEGIEKFS